MLDAAVKIYRACGRPDWNGLRFNGELVLEDDIKQAFDNLVEQDANFEVFNSEGVELEVSDLNIGQRYEVTLTVRSNTPEKFHPDFDTFKASVTHRLPSSYYLVAENWFSEDEVTPSQTSSKTYIKLKKLENSFKVTEDLAELSNFFNPPSAQGSHSKAVFWSENNTNSNPLCITFNHREIDFELCEELLDIGYLSELSDLSRAPNQSNHERVQIFINSMCEVVKTKLHKSEISLKEFLSLYKTILLENEKSFSAYLHNFSFNKIKRDIAEYELKFVKDMSSIVGDITTKLLGIPASFFLSILMLRSESLWENILLSLGLLLVGFIISSVVSSQLTQIKHITNAKEISIISIKNDRSIIPNEIQELLREFSIRTDKSLHQLNVRLIKFYIASWIPFVIGAGITTFQILDNLFTLNNIEKVLLTAIPVLFVVYLVGGAFESNKINQETKN